jgi:hypothetical protein
MKKLLLAAALATGALMTGGVATAGADTTVTVTPADIGTDWHTADTRPPGTGTFVNGPETPPLGSGSFRLQTLTNPEKVQLFTSEYDGVKLAAIDGIGYSTYRDPASTGFVAGVAALNLRIDTNGDSQPDAYLVYEPYQDQGNAAVLTGEWQDWDAYRGGQAKWWINTGGGIGCDQGHPCTWETIVTQLPNATIEEGANCGPKAPCPGSLGVNQGSFNSGIISNVDALYVSVGGSKTTYNFELVADQDGDGVPDEDDNCPTEPGDAAQNGCPLPTNKDQCKNGGWTLYGSTFKNQGDCVSYVASRGKNEPGKNQK